MPVSSRRIFSQFWLCSGIEFMMYYYQQLLSLTRCNESSFHEIQGLDLQSLSPNGIRIEGVRGDGQSRLSAISSVGLKIALFFLWVARSAYGVRQLLKPKAVFPKNTRRFAVWPPTFRFFETIHETFSDEEKSEVIYLTHQPALAEQIAKRLSTNQVFLIRDEGTLNTRPVTLLSILKKRLENRKFTAVNIMSPSSQTSSGRYLQTS